MDEWSVEDLEDKDTEYVKVEWAGKYPFYIKSNERLCIPKHMKILAAQYLIRQIPEKRNGFRISKVLRPNIFSKACLGQNIFSQPKLPHRDEAACKLSDAEYAANRQLPQCQCAGACLSESEHETQRELADGDDAHRGLTDGNTTRGKPSHSNDALCNNAPTCFRAYASGVMEQWQAQEGSVRDVLGKIRSGGGKMTAPSSVSCLLNLICDFFQQDIFHEFRIVLALTQQAQSASYQEASGMFSPSAFTLEFAPEAERPSSFDLQLESN